MFQGFTLVETAVTAGIISGAMVAVLGLFSASIGAARLVKDQTAAGVLLRQLVAESAAVPLTGPPAPITILYDSSLRPVESTENGANLTTDYEAGCNNPSATAIARITWSLGGPTGSAFSPGQPGAALIPTPQYLLEIRVETPASAPAQNRKVLRYVTLASP
jgi:type II secretory pathway pseudopilin PulG